MTTPSQSLTKKHETGTLVRWLGSSSCVCLRRLHDCNVLGVFATRCFSTWAISVTGLFQKSVCVVSLSQGAHFESASDFTGAFECRALRDFNKVVLSSSGRLFASAQVALQFRFPFRCVVRTAGTRLSSRSQRC